MNYCRPNSFQFVAFILNVQASASYNWGCHSQNWWCLKISETNFLKIIYT